MSAKQNQAPAAMGREEWNQLRVIARAPLHDSAVLDKSARDSLASKGYIIWSSSWNILTEDGVRICTRVGILKAP